MARVLVHNPIAQNPRKRKPLTREQVEKRQARAVRFAADILEDDDLADELDSLSPQEYAEHKGLLMSNPARKRKESRSMKRDELKQVVKDAVGEVIKQTRRSNPAPSAATAPVSAALAKSDKDKILGRVDDAAAALADGDEDEALDILNGHLDECDDEE